MGLNPAYRFDQARRTRIADRQLQRQRLRRIDHTEARTFLVPAGIDTSTFVLPASISVSVGNAYPADDSRSEDLMIPEIKRLAEFRGVIQDGEVTLRWELNGDVVATDHVITTTPDENRIGLTEPLLVQNGDLIKPIVTAGTGSDLSATFVVLVWAG